MNDNLKIYRASAGSGKTFTLALEYIKLLINDPYSYRRILAVTFTNKATAEMKERILSKLYGVANMLPDSNDYLQKIMEQMPEFDKQKIASRAQEALDLLLHDYGHFRIQTIDAFFQSLLRGLAKELDLNGDIEISLEDKELLSDAVDTYIKNLEPNTADFSQVVSYIESKLISGKQWRVGNELKSFAKNITKEEYQQRGDKLREEIEQDNGALLTKFYDEITEKKQKLEETTKKLAEEFFLLAQGCDATDFKGNESGIWGTFKKMRNGEIVKWPQTKAALASTPEKISAKCTKVNEIAALIKEAVPLYDEYINCELSLENYHQLGLLNNIAATLKEENTRENRFLLAETTHLLSTMVANNTSFIFEKIGTEIDHIFIDEFQDTSKLQWTCFEVLLKEVLARGNFNLIVGDVKQSIYRWRNSDWNIMNNIGSYFRRDQISYGNQDVKIDGITYKSTNYRSDRRIIEYNNALYRAAIESIKTSFKEKISQQGIKEIEQAYSDVEQAVPSKKEKTLVGYVEHRLIKKNNAGDKFVDNAVIQLMDTLHHLIEEKGVSPGEIAILMRTKKERMQLVVDAFNKRFPHLKIVSDEAYRLSSSLTVQLIISALRYIAQPTDKVNIANMIRLYEKVINGVEQNFTDKINGNIEEFIPTDFRSSLQRLKELPLYEMIEQLLALLDISKAKDEEAYIYTFLDCAAQFINSRSSDINKLLKAWEESINEKSIPAESVDSVRIMTIHKSKGLEFHTVIIPLCDWILTGDNRTMLWCKPTAKPYDTLSLLPINCKKEMKDSTFQKEYYDEYLYQVVDNLNILYVATTRAKSNLFIFTDGSNGRGENVSKLMNTIVDNIVHLPGSKYDKDAGIFTFGDIVCGKAKEKTEKEENEKNPFEVKPEVTMQPFVYYDSRVEFRQSNETERFLTNDDEKMAKQYEYIEDGKLMHLVMSGITGVADIRPTLDRLMIEGLIASIEQYEKIRRLVERAISNKNVAEWFDGNYKLYNECTILSNGERKSRRPDRVMVKGNTAVVVDYKFGKVNKDYNNQVKDYMTLLSDIGYSNVKGYVWYVNLNKIEEV
ncbi:MAG: UvrD-helicase domain-containing protein [Bacteroidaceae bacterium]|nr:UvrD-helicase domain-containing protein [Bacteroidaceae bacterium]